MNGRDEKCIRLLPENLKGGDHLEDRGVDEKNNIKADLKDLVCAGMDRSVKCYIIRN
jgi:hypothetical protein